MFILTAMLCLYSVNVFCGVCGGCGCCDASRTTEPLISFSSFDTKNGNIVGESHEFSKSIGKNLNIVKNDDNSKFSEYHGLIDNIKKDIKSIGLNSEFINNIEDDYFINDELIKELNKYHDLVAKIKAINNEMNNLPPIDLAKYTKYYNSLFDRLKDFGDFKSFDFDKNSDFSIILLFIFKNLLVYVDCKPSFGELFKDSLNRYNIYHSYINDKKKCMSCIARFNRLVVDANTLKDFNIIINKAKDDLNKLKLNNDLYGNITKFYVRTNPNGRAYVSYSDIIPVFKNLNIEALRTDINKFLRYINQCFRLNHLGLFNKILPVSGALYKDYNLIPAPDRVLIEKKGCKDVVSKLLSANTEINVVISEIDGLLKQRADTKSNNLSKIEKCKFELGQIEQSISNIIADLRKRKSNKIK